MAAIILGPILGGLSNEGVNLWARADQASTLCAWIGIKPDGSDAKLAGKTNLKASTGYAGIVSIRGLDPAKRYFYALTLEPTRKPSKSTYQSFKTFPDPGALEKFRFAFGSCFLPRRIEPGLAFRHLHEKQADLAFLLMLGDQIYVDNTKLNGLNRIPVSLDDYRRVYQNNWSNPYLRNLLAHTPAYMILDDHEVDNDWKFNDPGLSKPGISWMNSLPRLLKGMPRDQTNLYLARLYAALQANWEHQVMHGPKPCSPRGPLAYEFEYGSAAFFVLDTRTQRFIGGGERELLGSRQWEMLEAWLVRVKDSHPVKFIVSSISILADVMGDFTQDRWSGFRQERNRLLFLLAENGVEGVHFLAGDLHSAHSISAKVKGPEGRTIPVWEFCSSPFEQKPFKLAQLLGQPASSPALFDAKRHFSVSEVNYGIVEVGFAEDGTPEVRFELNYEKNGAWFTRG